MKRLFVSFLLTALAACAAGDDDTGARRGRDPVDTLECGPLPDECTNVCEPEMEDCGSCCSCDQAGDTWEWSVWVIDCFPDGGPP